MTRDHRLCLFALVALLLAGCISPRKITFIDAPHPGRPTIQRVRADGDMLHITVAQDSPGTWIAGVKAEVVAGDVYLSTLHISSVVHTTEFSADMSRREIPRDWRSRLYWIVGDSISSPINPLIEHVREIRRSKIQL